MVLWCVKFRSFDNYAEHLNTDHDVKRAMKNSEVIVIAFFKDIKSQAAKYYLKAARDYEEYRLSFTADTKSMERLGVYTFFVDTVIIYIYIYICILYITYFFFLG